MKIRNKKAWLRIVEAFIAVLLILTTLLIVLSKQKTDYDESEEIMKLQRAILDSINQDDKLRTDILNNNLSNINTRIEKIIPPYLNYTTRICVYEDVCSICVDESCTILNQIENKEIYAQEVPIVANLTYFNFTSPKKLKLFLWKE